MPETRFRAAEPPTFEALRRMHRSVGFILAGYLLLHVGLLFAFDATHPDAFLRGDSSIGRMMAVRAVLASPTPLQLWNVVQRHGLVGQYMWHALAFWASAALPQPQLMVVMLQILLNALSMLFLARTVHSVTGDPRLVTGTLLFYAVLPHSFAFPHLLVSEAIFVPLALFSLYHLVRFVRGGCSWWSAGASAFFLALATLTRPYVLVFPLCALPLLMAWRPRAWRRYLLLCLGTLLPVTIWVSVSLRAIGHANLASGSPTTFNEMLHSKAGMIIATLPPGERARMTRWLASRDSSRFSPTDMAGLYARYPGHTLLNLALETAKITLKLDETKVLNYLGIWESEEGWDKRLPVLGLSYFWRTQKLVVSLVVVGAFLWAAVMACAAYGIRVLLRRRDIAVALALVYLIVVLGVPPLVDHGQGRFRYPGDGLICMFAVAGFDGLVNERRRRRGVRPDPRNRQTP